MNITRWIKALAMGLAGSFLLSMTSFTAACEELSDHVVRLHVIAASDSEQDQAIKREVRDAVLAQTDGLLTGIRERDTALLVLTDALDDIERAANHCLAVHGCMDRACVTLCDRVYFPTRHYETATFPAGEYTALRVVIGEGKGQNWWCVAFPPMCLSGASEAQWSDVLTASEERLIEGESRYRVQFKIVEWIAAVKERLTA